MLARHQYKLDAAVDAYYDEGPPSGSAPTAAVSGDKLSTLFNQYKGTLCTCCTRRWRAEVNWFRS